MSDSTDIDAADRSNRELLLAGSIGAIAGVIVTVVFLKYTPLSGNLAIGLGLSAAVFVGAHISEFVVGVSELRKSYIQCTEANK